jgi:hypothetical protein
MVGLAKRLARDGTGEHIDRVKLKAAYEGLLVDAAYRDSITRATANEDSVSYRLSAATTAFDRI